MAVLLAVLAPSLLRYVEDSRMQRDDSAMDEVCNSVQLAMSDADTYDEVFSYAIPNNYMTYTDSSGVYGSRITDEEFWAPDGSGHCVTITFNPNDNGEYIIAEGIVNDMTYGNGSVAEKRVSEGVKQCALSEMGNQKLYSAIKKTIGTTISEKSATYRNSSYTVFIAFDLVNQTYKPNIYGAFNGTNLSDDCPAAIGSGTSDYTESGEANVTKPGGTQKPTFTSSDLSGGGSAGETPEKPSYKKDELPCGHLKTMPGDHTQKECGHYNCGDCDCVPAPCGVEGHVVGDGLDHSPVNNHVGHDYACLCNGWQVPEGGEYTSVKTGVVYSEGQKLACDYQIAPNDTYKHGDYTYTYISDYISGYGWSVSLNLDVTTKSEEQYGPILEMINNKPVTCMYTTFYGCSQMIIAPKIPSTVKVMGNRYTMGYTDIGVFSGCTSLIEGPEIPYGVIDLTRAFYNCTSMVKAPDIPDSVTDAHSLFYKCKSLTTAPKLSKSLTSLSSVFYGCTALTEAPEIPEGVTGMFGTFQDCSSLKTPPVIPSKVTEIRQLFAGCSSLEIAPILPKGATNLDRIFEYCKSLRTYVGSTEEDGHFAKYILPSKTTTMENTFWHCTSLLESPALPESVWNLKGTFAYTSISNIVPQIPQSALNMSYTFYQCQDLKIAPAIPTKVTNMSSTFSNCTSLESPPDMSQAMQVSNMEATFYNCKNLAYAPILPDTVTNLRQTFNSCTSIKAAPVIPSNATDMFACFNNCTNMITATPIPSSVTSLHWTFTGCTSLIEAPDLSNAINVTQMQKTFADCTSLTSVNVIPASVTDMTWTFDNCQSLTGVIEINANPNYYSCFDGTTLPITLTGTSTVLNEIADQYSNITVAQTQQRNA